MITREDLRELAEFQGDDADCAISFLFSAVAPHDKSHREQAILAKDLVRQALREVEKNGRNEGARADLQRILELAGELGAKPGASQGGVCLQRQEHLA